MQTCKEIAEKLLLVVCACLLVSGVAFGLEPQAEQQIRNILSTCMDQVREHHTGRECDQFDRMCKEYGPGMFTYLEEYVADPCSRVRWHAYRSIIFLGLDVNDVQARREMVDKLVRRLEEEEQVALNWQYLLQRLARFTWADFSEPSRQLVRDLLLQAFADTRMSRRGDIILLAGVADLKSELPQLKQLIEEQEVILKERHQKHLEYWREMIEGLPDTNNMPAYLPRRKRFEKQLKKQYWQSSLVWDALRARARMGAKEDIARCIELVESHPYENYRVAGLLKELSYVRQPEVVDYLSKYLKSDKMVVYDADDVEFMSYGQYAATALGQMLRGFPHKKDYGLTKETIEHCRKWMAEQKQWDIIR